MTDRQSNKHVILVIVLGWLLFTTGIAITAIVELTRIAAISQANDPIDMAKAIRGEGY